MPFPRHLVKEWGKLVNWCCEDCGKKWSEGFIVEGHHVKPTNAGGTDVKENFKLLCLECHYKAHLDLRSRGLDHPSSANLVKARLDRTGGKWRL